MITAFVCTLCGGFVYFVAYLHGRSDGWDSGVDDAVRCYELGKEANK